MKLKNKRANSSSLSKKKGLVIGALILVLTGLAGAAFFIKGRNSNSEKSPRDDSAQTDSAKKSATNNSSNDTGASIKDEATNPESQPHDDRPVPTPTQGPSVTMAGFSQQNRQVAVSVNVSGGSASSVCTFTFSHRDAKPVVRQTQSDGKTCSTSIPEVEFSIIGIWQLNVSLYNGSSKLAETNQSVTIQ